MNERNGFNGMNQRNQMNQKNETLSEGYSGEATLIIHLKEVFRAKDKEKILSEGRRPEFIFSRSEETDQLLL